MGFTTILTELAGSTYVITLNRPERRNAISVKCMEEIMAAVGEAEDQAGVGGVIITGGLDCFSAGADLNEAAALNTRSEGPGRVR